MTQAERKARMAALQARREARGMADPLARLRTHNARCIAEGAPVFVNQPAETK